MEQSTLTRVRGFINSRGFVQSMLLAALSFGATTGMVAHRRADKAKDAAAFTRLAAVRRAGPQLVLVYIGSARCTWCKHPALPGYVAAIRDSLSARATERKLHFTTLGIAVDVLKSEGIAHLLHVNAFDQIAAGGSWLNEGMVNYVWSRYGAPSATPQVMVLTRSLIRDGGEFVTFRIADEKLIARKVGLREMESWVREGVPLPRLGD